MKTKFMNVFLVPMLLLLSVVTFNSCSDDDDDAPFVPNIIGTWYIEGYDGYTIEFKSNNTGLETLSEQSSFIQSSFEYTYSPSESKVTIIGSNEMLNLENGTYIAQIGANKMTFGGTTFTRK